MHIYTAWNGPAPTTAAQASVTTGTTIKTMLQISTPSTRQIQLVEWGYMLDDAPNADSVVELIQAATAATVTAHVAAGVQPLDPNAPASLVTLGTANTGYTSSNEGTPSGVRVFDVSALDSAAGNVPLVYRQQWMPDARPIVAVSTFLRVRVTFGQAADMRCYVTWIE